MAMSLELAITAIRSGRKAEGRQLLNLLIQQNPNNEMAWLWMSSVVENDEQRARCLYHVLAIDPDNAVARQGLKVLGIVVSDSRPVKVPRDSQPINIPKPSQRPQTGPLRALPETSGAGQPAAEERRPFALDPETIAAELPFKPITSPFKPDPADDEPDDETDTAEAPQPEPKKQTGPLPKPSEPVWVKRAKEAPPPKRQTGPLDGQPEPATLPPRHNQPRPVPQIVHQQGQPVARRQPINGIKLKIAPRQIPQTGSLAQSAPPDRARQQTEIHPTPAPPPPSEPVAPVNNPPPQRLGQTEPMIGASVPQAQNLQNPSEPVPVAQNTPPAQPPGHHNGQPPAQPGQPTPDSGPFQHQPQHQPPNVSNQQPWPNQPAPQPNNGQGQGYNGAPAFNSRPAAQETRPTQPMATPPAMNPTQGMSAYYQNNQPGYGAHANATLGMPPQQQAPMPPHSQAVAAMHAQATMGMPPQPSPVFHTNTTMGVPLSNYGQNQPPPPYPAVHSNSTMAMPTNQANLVDYRSVNAPPPPHRDVEDDEEAEEGINILAVIIFGSLSVTALGGLGMLILLMFTGN